MVQATLDALDEAVDGLRIGLDRAELGQVQRAVDRLSAKLVAAYGEFDAAELWDLDAATSMTAWLGEHGNMSGGDAARVLRQVRRLRELPVTSGAALDGTLSAGQVRAIVANISDRTAGLFAEHEAELVPTLAALPAADVARAMRQWRALAEASLDDSEESEPSSKLHLSMHYEGRWRLDGDLEALDGEVVDTALRLAESADTEGEAPRTSSQRRADALADICSFFLERHEHPEGSRQRPHVNVIVSADDLQAGRGGTCADGTVLDGPSVASLVCHSVLHRVVMADSVILGYGTRPNPPAQRPNAQRRHHRPPPPRPGAPGVAATRRGSAASYLCNGVTWKAMRISVIAAKGKRQSGGC